MPPIMQNTAEARLSVCRHEKSGKGEGHYILIS